MHPHHIAPASIPTRPWTYRFTSDDGSGVEHPVPASEAFSDDGSGVEHPVPASEAFSDDGSGVEHPVGAAEDFVDDADAS